MAQQILNTGTGNNTGDGDALRVAMTKVNENTTELYTYKTPNELVYVDDLSKLPAAVSNVITLLANYTYYFVKDIDLLGDRLVGAENTVILGTSSENASITSTGLGVSVALFTTTWTTPVQNIAFKDVGTALDIDGLGNSAALDWNAVNFVNVPTIGVIKDINNFIYINGAFLNSKGMSFDGTFSTIAFGGSVFVGDGLAGDLINILSTAIISVRFRVIYSSIVAFGSTQGVTVDASSIIPEEAFILDTVSFSGGGTYLGGVDHTSNKALFIKCNPIENTFVNGQLYMQGNATATVISASSTFYKVLGTTTASAENNKFSHSNNRLTCDATVARKYLIQCTLSFTSGNNKECEFGFYDSKLAAIRLPSRTKTTSDGVGKSSPITLICVVDFVNADYLEIWSANNTDTTNITVSQMNFVITEI
tara:strand:- start:20151 stop:21416 length:1266 start_codon:yes stop_codon:yes gene_type:complete